MFRFYLLLLFLSFFPPLLFAGEWCPDGQAAYCEVYALAGRWGSPSACAANAGHLLGPTPIQESETCWLTAPGGSRYCFPMKCQACPPGQVPNPNSGYCQLPCPTNFDDAPPWESSEGCRFHTS